MAPAVLGSCGPSRDELVLPAAAVPFPGPSRGWREEGCSWAGVGGRGHGSGLPPVLLVSPGPAWLMSDPRVAPVAV